ncbi:MAG TPA: hypothetical protein DHV36_22095 [Desulfobacteraceae bacterium]|nr:hypothetical protein [Desulfobacteraceae bacterium]|tara:strand:- start:464 stop:1039 length:576 start_codon:yes stop_codon:yes gene_type:complete
MARFSLIAPVSTDLTQSIKSKVVSFIDTYGPTTDSVGFDPHITLAYFPSSVEIDEGKKKEVRDELRDIDFPIEFRLLKSVVTNYGSVQIPLEASKVDIRIKHLRILRTCLPNALWTLVLNGTESKKLSVFQTNNIGTNYRPHITVFRDNKKGPKFRPLLDDLIGRTIKISTFYWADSVSPPLKWLSDYQSK